MAIKIEIQSTTKLPKNTESIIEAVVASVPREHLRGVERVRVVDFISNSRLKNMPQMDELPGLYHPRQGSSGAWFEIAAAPLLKPEQSFVKRVMPRLAFKGNLAAVIFSLAGQHYYLTLRHSLKKAQLEPAVRGYTEKQLKVWQERTGGLRAKIFKPLQPMLEKWGRKVQKKVVAEKKKAKSR